MRRELWTLHGRVEVSISVVPEATHLPVSVTSYYIDSDPTGVIEYAVQNCLLMNTVFMKHTVSVATG